MLSMRVDVSPTASLRHLTAVPGTDYTDTSSSMSDLIWRLTLAPVRLESSIVGLTLDECRREVLPGEPSILECIEHVAIHGLDWSEQFYQAIADTYPNQRSHNSHWKERLAAEARTGLSAALGVFRKHNKSIAEFLATLPQSDFDRPFSPLHSTLEPFYIRDGIHWGLVLHCDYHLATIHKMRTALGKPLDWMAVYQTRYPRPT